MKTREEYELEVAREQPKQLIDVQNGVYDKELVEDIRNCCSAAVIDFVEKWEEAKSWELARKNVSED